MIYIYGEEQLQYLRGRDALLGRAIDRIGRIDRQVIPDFYAALVNSIIGQQISSRAAQNAWEKLLLLIGEASPEKIVSVEPEVLRGIGISMRKVRWIQSAAELVLQGKIDLTAFSGMPDEKIVEQLTQLDGVGHWTAEMLLIFSLQRPDVVSWSDFGIRRGMEILYGHTGLSKSEFKKHQKQYAPYGTVASLYLWEIAKGK